MAKNIDVDVDNVRDIRIEKIFADELPEGYAYVVRGTYDLLNVTDDEALAVGTVVMQFETAGDIAIVDDIIKRLKTKARKERIETKTTKAAKAAKAARV